MARIKTYVNDDNISEYDTVIGSDAESLNGTKNYSMASILKFLKSGFNPETGGDLSIRELSYTGSTYTTPHAYLNSLDPYITILQYDVVIVNINETKYLLKKQDITVGFEQTPLLSSDFILIKEPQVKSDWNSTSGFSQILNKPTIPASQVNSDWNATSGVSQVLNKPTIPASQINSDWNSSSGVSQILNKPTVDGSETKVNSGTNINVTGAGTVASPYVISLPASAAWLPGDTKEVVCDSTYLTNNFVSSGTTAGLGTNERLGWAIMNGNNGTQNDNGKVVIAYGTSYTTLGATGGNKDAVVVAHSHNILGGGGLDSGLNFVDTTAETNTRIGITEITGESGIDKNMQPYVVRLRIVKL